jgi:hypothetical protein
MNLENPTAAPESSARAGADLATTLLHVAWMAILLGVIMEILLLIVGAGLGKAAALPGMLADTVQKVSWSGIVCVGLAVGKSATRVRVPAMGFAGLLSAPAAFTISRSLHKGVGQSLGVVGTASIQELALVLGLLKSIEYAALGTAIGWLSRRFEGKMAAYLAAGLCAGAIFGTVSLALLSPLSREVLIFQGMNEVLFPVGCSLVLYASDVLGKRARG